uniref:TNF receptor superfamily member 18 n=1 Tax=Equus caballus TaxID=9796 RepID=F6WCV5_HORSE
LSCPQGQLLSHAESQSPWVGVSSGQWGDAARPCGLRSWASRTGGHCWSSAESWLPDRCLCPLGLPEAGGSRLPCLTPRSCGRLAGAPGREGSAQLLRGLACLPPGEVCPEQNCTCVQPEFHCADPRCTSCQHHPCPPGQEAQPHGSFRFGFTCVDCAAGTFSGGREGRCKPWADCSQFGFPTTFPGNKTHNAVCSPWPLPTEPHDLLTVVLLVVATCILILTVAQVGLHVWQLKRQRGCPTETQLLLEAPPPAEDACSCQFPEEERGEQLSEDKGQLGDLWV